MKRPALVTATAAMQSALVALVVAIAVYILMLTRSPQPRAGKDAADIVRGMLIAVAVLAGWATLAFVASAGLWRKRRWGWWLALIFNLSTAAVIFSDSIDGSTGSKFTDRVMYFLHEFEDWSPAIIFIALVVFLLLPSVRRFYFGLQPTVATGKSAAGVVSAPQ